MDPVQSELRCPKCGAAMKATSRKGPFSTCPECRGVFIDRAAMKRGGNPLRQVVMSVVLSVVASVVVSRVMRRRHKAAA